MTELTHKSEHRDDTGSKLGMWLFLFTEILRFGGLFLVYSVYRSMHPQDFHVAAAGLSTVLGTVNTVILITSSLTRALAISAIRRGSTRQSVLLQVATIALGLVFLVNKYFEWSGHIHEGLYPNSPDLLARSHGQVLFYGLYYVMTGLHRLHVVAGMLFIGIMLSLTVRQRINPEDNGKLENAGLYWHLAAAAIANSRSWEVGWQGMRFAIAGFLIPYMFVLGPAMVLAGDWWDIALSVVTGFFGTAALAGSVQGWLLTRCSKWERIVLFIGALCLIKPGWITDIIGAVIMAGIVVLQLARRKTALATA